LEKSTFVSKTKAALRYYQHGVNSGEMLCTIIGDSYIKIMKKNERHTMQKNDAILVELASALAVLNLQIPCGEERVVKEIDRKRNQ